MDFFDIIKERYSVRGYKPDEVEKEKLDKVLEAGIIAPTGVNFQPFKIFVIDTKKNKEALEKIYPQKWFVEAPLVLCVAADKSKAWNRPWDGKNIADIDATIVMDHIILAATALGLGTCYIAAFKKYAAIKFLDLDEEYEPVLFTPLGYPDVERTDRPRKSVNELVVYK
ncbi:nitroreductase family protein [Methanobrevibacter filiformis]|uniref:FMN reductase n=1 Tax=Methanobrevibacter filiformis TaxID=55758 RepID=A0A165Z683_9EURY|nr:nitroreductase family protein [Methanobrevibacter filiformis]KZX10298.1 FMN reductase [Methanobrevibacter filiformis]